MLGKPIPRPTSDRLCYSDDGGYDQSRVSRAAVGYQPDIVEPDLIATADRNIRARSALERIEQ